MRYEELNWTYVGESLGPEELDAVEGQFGIRLHPDHREFLLDGVNGGLITADTVIPTVGRPGGAVGLQWVYGIGAPHQEHTTDLRYWLENGNPDLVERRPRFIPFGSDHLGCELVIDTESEEGTVYFFDPDYNELYYSAKNLVELFQRLCESIPLWIDLDSEDPVRRETAEEQLVLYGVPRTSENSESWAGIEESSFDGEGHTKGGNDTHEGGLTDWGRKPGSNGEPTLFD